MRKDSSDEDDDGEIKEDQKELIEELVPCDHNGHTF
jgi:hypothetical protein